MFGSVEVYGDVDSYGSKRSKTEPVEISTKKVLISNGVRIW